MNLYKTIRRRDDAFTVPEGGMSIVGYVGLTDSSSSGLRFNITWPGGYSETMGRGELHLVAPWFIPEGSVIDITGGTNSDQWFGILVNFHRVEQVSPVWTYNHQLG